MARYNEILAGRYARAVQKLFSMKGEVPVGSLAGELQMVHLVQSGAENRYLEAWDRFGFGVITAATAAQTNGVQLRNPVGSNVIAVVEKLLVSVGGAMNLTLSNGSGADLTTTANGNPYDGRSGRSSSVIASSSVASPANLGASLGTWAMQANVPLDFVFTDIQEVPITPGTSFRITTSLVNTQFAALFMWRERELEESERQ